MIMKIITGGVTAAKGFRAASTAAGIKYQAFPRQPAVNQSVNQTVNRWLFRMEVPFAGLLLP